MIDGDNRPPEEEWYAAAHDWLDKDAAARMLEETKSAVFSQRCQVYTEAGMAVNKAEQTVKASPEHLEFVTKMVEARTAANAAWIEREYCKMKVMRRHSMDATNRVEARL